MPKSAVQTCVPYFFDLVRRATHLLELPPHWIGKPLLHEGVEHWTAVSGNGNSDERLWRRQQARAAAARKQGRATAAPQQQRVAVESGSHNSGRSSRERKQQQQRWQL